MQTFLSSLSHIGDTQIDLTLADATILSCQKVVRVVPNKRTVCKAKWQGKRVFAKIFIGKDAKKYAARDATGVKTLTQAGIKTPMLLLETSAQLEGAETAQVLVFEEIKNAKTAEYLIKNQGEKARFELAKSLVQTIAFHHDEDILHTDIHLNNFLVDDGFIYTLDGDGVKQFADLSYKRAWQNLAEIISKLDVLDQQKWLAALLVAYWEICPWNMQLTEENLAGLANWQRIKAASSFADKKVFRQCTDVNINALGGLFHAASSHANLMLPKNISALDALMQPQNLLKNGNTCTVALAEIDGKKIVIKRYNIKNFWHGLSRAFRQTRAAVSWANAHRLKILGIATAQPIALIESRKFGYLRGKAYFLAEYIDAPDVAEYFAKTHEKAERAEAVKNIVTLFYRLFLLQISHGDMKATNIKMHNAQPVLIDLDSMRQHKKNITGSVAHQKDLNRFMQNWQNQPALYNAFVKTFKVIYPDVSILIKAGIGQNKEISHKEISS
jgi:tRNA A-37 threonylcarbamoyl transferase component Bud32